MPRLDVFLDSKLFLRFNLDREIVNIGRHSWCEVQLPSQTISRFHARITPSEDGRYWIENQSSNGTLLNGEKLEERAELRPGDRFVIAQYLLAYYPEEAPSIDSEYLPTLGPG